MKKFVRFSTRGGSAPGYIGVRAHPQAVVVFRGDAPNNQKMIDNGFMSEAFEKDPVELLTCSDPHCEGLYFFKDSSDWRTHIRYAHTPRPGSPLGDLQARSASKVAEFDQAAQAEVEAREKKAELEVEVKAIKEQLKTMEKPKPVSTKES